MSVFTRTELEFLDSAEYPDGAARCLARIATVGKDGTPHVAPVGFRYDPEHDAIEIRGYTMVGSKKYRDVQRTGRAAVVVDDLATVAPWRPRGIEVRGSAEAVDGARPLNRIYPGRIVPWGLEADGGARTVNSTD